MATPSPSAILVVGPWTADHSAGRLRRGDEARAVEPKVMDLLFLLTERPGAVFSRDEVMAALWPGVTVGDDTLARTVSKLRKALDDDARAPRFVETIPKRGYRLMVAAEAPAPRPDRLTPTAVRRVAGRKLWLMVAAAVITVALALGLFLMTRPGAPTSAAAQLVARADDEYFQYTRAGNESAIELYERALTIDPDDSGAYAGLANALVQRVIRWPGAPGGPEITHRDLAEAIRTGRTSTPAARVQLERAQGLAERAVSLKPGDPAALKALGFVHSARGDLAAAEAAYHSALALDKDAWGVLINLGDVAELRGDSAAALTYFERAYDAMTRRYKREAPRIRPWQAKLGVLIAARHSEAGRRGEAERWLRKVLAVAPLDEPATVALARIQFLGGDLDGGRRLCRELAARTGPSPACAAAIRQP